MKNLMAFLGRIDAGITAILKWLTIVMFLALTLIVTVNILLRVFPITSLHWTDEIVELCFAWLVFYGAAGVWMIKGHFSVGDWIRKVVKSDRAYNGCRLVLELITLGFVFIFFWYSLSLTLRAHEVTSVFQIPKKVLYSSMPISSLIMVVYSLVYVIRSVIGIANPQARKALEPETKK